VRSTDHRGTVFNSRQIHILIVLPFFLFMQNHVLTNLFINLIILVRTTVAINAPNFYFSFL
jgi:hypothetical protein